LSERAPCSRSATSDGMLGSAMPTLLLSVKNRRLRETYNPVKVASVHRVDDAREVGRTKLAEHKQASSVMGTRKEVS
jgi:hypothetical protein